MMITTETMTYRDELMALAAEIHDDNPHLDPWSAFDQAARMLPSLLADVMIDARYTPRRVVVFDLLTAEELVKMTDR